MKRAMKKLLVFALVLTMVASNSLTAFATENQDGNGEVTKCTGLEDCAASEHEDTCAKAIADAQKAAEDAAKEGEDDDTTNEGSQPDDGGIMPASLEGQNVTPAGTLETGVVVDDANKENDSYIYFDIKGLCASESIEIELYSGETLLSTTVLKKTDYLSNNELGANVEITRKSNSWETTWEIEPIDNLVPNKAVLYVDGTETDDADVRMYSADVPSDAREWGEVEGVKESPKGTITYGYVSDNRIWGEATGNADESFVIKVYSDEKLLVTTSLNDKENIIDGSVDVTWGPYTDETVDDWWTTTWETETLDWKEIPNRVELYVDGVKVAENIVQLNAPDNLRPIEWWEVEGVEGAPIVVIDAAGNVFKHDMFANAVEEKNIKTIVINKNISEVLPTDLELIIENDVIITAPSAVTVNLYNNGTSYDLVVGGSHENAIIEKLTIDENVTLSVSDRIIWIGYYGNDIDVIVDGTLGGSQMWIGADTVVNRTGTLNSSGGALVMRRGATLTVDGGKLNANYFSILSGNIDAKNTVITSGPVWIGNTENYAGEGSVNIKLDNTTWTSNSNLKMVSDGSALINLTNGSVMTTAVNGEHGASIVDANSQIWIDDSTLNTSDMTVDGSIDICNGMLNVADGKTLTLNADATMWIRESSNVKGDFAGVGTIYLDNAKLDSDTNITSKAAIKAASGISNICGSKIDVAKFQVGHGAYQSVDENVDTENDVIVNLTEGAVLEVGGGTYAGWVGTAYYGNNDDKLANMTSARYILNIEDSAAAFGYLHVSNDGILNVKGFVPEEDKLHAASGYQTFYAGDFIINGKATLDGVDARIQYGKVSCDNNGTDAGVLNIENDAEITFASEGNANRTALTVYNGTLNISESMVSARVPLVKENAVLNISDSEFTTNKQLTVDGKLKLDEARFYGAILVNEGATADINGGLIISENSAYSAIESTGNLTLENVYVKSARHAIRVKGGTTTINSGYYSVLGTADMTTHAINAGGEATEAKVIINGGTFIGPEGTAADSGAAVNVQDNATVEIKDGAFCCGKNDALSANSSSSAKLIVYGGKSDKPIEKYLADGMACASGTYPYDGELYLYAVVDADSLKSVVDIKVKDNETAVSGSFTSEEAEDAADIAESLRVNPYILLESVDDIRNELAASEATEKIAKEKLEAAEIEITDTTVITTLVKPYMKVVIKKLNEEAVTKIGETIVGFEIQMLYDVIATTDPDNMITNPAEEGYNTVTISEENVVKNPEATFISFEVSKNLINEDEHLLDKVLYVEHIKSDGSIYNHEADLDEDEETVDVVSFYNNRGYSTFNLKIAENEVPADKPFQPTGGGSASSGSSNNSSDKKEESKEPTEVYYASGTSTQTSGAKTGDASNTFLWISIMGLALAAAVAVFAIKKKSAK